jgi:hypothetical protein
MLEMIPGRSLGMRLWPSQNDAFHSLSAGTAEVYSAKMVPETMVVK